MEIPRIKKVVINIGLGEAMDNPKALDAAVIDLTAITGQKTSHHQSPQEYCEL